jgi:predicted flavoprotein YhiN
VFIDMGIDYIFYPEHIAAREVINLLGHTSTTEYVEFSGGKLSLIAFRLELTGTRPVAEAIVTAGGVKRKEVHPVTMESRLVQGLYFAGEVLDVDGYTGGFNLQAAWATGYAAGNAAARTASGSIR